MTFRQELASWMAPSPIDISPIPKPSQPAPSTAKLLEFPRPERKPSIITFLRHCGCPFAEQTLLELRKLAASESHKDIEFIAISHSDQEATDRWLAAIDSESEKESESESEGQGRVHVIVDPQRAIYARWGLGTSSAWHVLNPWSLYAVYRAGRDEGIWNRPTESGSRWQQAGSAAVDGEGVVRWVSVAKSADERPDFEEGIRALTK